MYIYDPSSQSETVADILAAIREIQTVGASGAMQFSHIAGTVFNLSGKREVLPTKNNCYREVWITNKSGQNVFVFLGEVKVLQIFPGETYSDMFNSGMKIDLEGTGEVQVVVRSSEPIILNENDNNMAPIEIQLYLPTGSGFSSITQPYEDAESALYQNNLNKFLNSELDVDGFKLVGFHSFPFATSIIFTIQLADDGAFINPNAPVRFYWLNPIIAANILIAIASDVINPESNLIDSRVSGLLYSEGFGGETDTGGGAINIKPSVINHFGRFSAVRQDTGQYDTAIISHYESNPDPLLGGIFHLVGF